MPNLVALISFIALAQNPNEQAARIAYQQALAAKIQGPTVLQIENKATLKLPANAVFIPKGPADNFWKTIGNYSNDLFGLIICDVQLPTETMIAINISNGGHIDDAEGGSLNPSDLLRSIKEGTAADNEKRKRDGHGVVEVVGWKNLPNYDKTRNLLSWSITANEPGLGSSTNNSYIFLTREGFISFSAPLDNTNLVKGGNDLQAITQSLQVSPGQKYDEFKPGIDKMAEVGLAALITGVAAKKLGLFAVIAAFVIKAWKVIAFGAVVLFGLIGKLFAGRSASRD